MTPLDQASAILLIGSIAGLVGAVVFALVRRGRPGGFELAHGARARWLVCPPGPPPECRCPHWSAGYGDPGGCHVCGRAL